MGAIQASLNGFANGLPLAVLAIAFALVYLPTGVLHLALGSLYVIAPLVVGSMRQAGTSWTLAVLTALAVSVLLSLICDIFGHRRLARRTLSPVPHVICSLGFYVIFIHSASMVWGDQTHVLTSAINQSWKFGTVFLTRSQAISGSISILTIVLCLLLLHLTGMGLRFRAHASNPREASLRGIDISRLRIYSFALSGALVATAGILSSLDKGITPQAGGLSALTLGIVAFVIGGRHTFAGSVPGALFVSLSRSWAEFLTSSQWMNATSYSLLIIFLLLRPEGIVRRQGRIEERT